ncbi:MAG: NUDIX domain-containing protein [Micromonosporaceae bacterium]|nr:NUDIX domain-containing protein [Micromonosporaceae bacterium]
MTSSSAGVSASLGRVLDGYRPATGTEAADLVRVRALLATAPDPWRRDIPLHLTASAIVVHPPTGRVLLRWHDRVQAWLHVGGHGDPGESDPVAIALREASEETGLTDLKPWPGPDLVQLSVVPVSAGKGEPAHEHADLRYALATGEPDAARPESPTTPLRWLSIVDALAIVDLGLQPALGRVGALLP